MLMPSAGRTKQRGGPPVGDPWFRAKQSRGLLTKELAQFIVNQISPLASYHERFRAVLHEILFYKRHSDVFALLCCYCMICL